MVDPKAVEKTGLAEKDKHRQDLENWLNENVENNGQPRPFVVDYDDNDDEEKEKEVVVFESFHIRPFDVFDDPSSGGDSNGGGGTVRGSGGVGVGNVSVDGGDREGEEQAVGDHPPWWRRVIQTFIKMMS